LSTNILIALELKHGIGYQKYAMRQVKGALKYKKNEKLGQKPETDK
jgi:hypothetical protein